MKALGGRIRAKRRVNHPGSTYSLTVQRGMIELIGRHVVQSDFDTHWKPLGGGEQQGLLPAGPLHQPHWLHARLP